MLYDLVSYDMAHWIYTWNRKRDLKNVLLMSCTTISLFDWKKCCKKTFVEDQSCFFFAGNDGTVIKVATSDPENSSYKPISKFDTVNKGLFIGNKAPINWP